MKTIFIKAKQLGFLFFIIINLFLVDLKAQDVEFLEESTITNQGLYFWYPNGEKAFHYSPSISPRGDCMAVVNGYIYFGWYKGGMSNRDVMISRKKIGSGNWVTVQLPHKNTLIGRAERWGDSHNTISVGVSKIDGTVHVFYDHHNDPLKYIVSKKNIAFAPDSEFKLANFNRTRGYLAVGENIRITYPKITHTSNGEVIVNYRKGSAVGGNEMVHVYNGDKWTKSKQVTRGGGIPHVAQNDRNYAYGTPYYKNGEVYYAFSVRWARNKEAGFANEGLYLAKTGPTFTDKWEDPNGVKHDLPIQDYSPFLIAPITQGSRGSGGSPELAVTENGDVHVTYNERFGRTSDGVKKFSQTYTRKAGEMNFTKHEDVIVAGMAWGNRFYTTRLSKSAGKITILSGEPGSVDYESIYTLDTDYSFGDYAQYLDNDGKLVLIISDNKQSDKRKIYSFVFQLDGGGTVSPPSNQAPTVKITSPEDGAVFELGEQISFGANASDPDGNLDKVNFFVNGDIEHSDNSRPFGDFFTPTEAGTYEIKARAIDRENSRSDAVITITVVERNEAPVASFSTPIVNTLEEGYDNLVVTVDATDPNGDDFSVLLKINGEEIRKESVAPYEWGHSRSPNSQETVGLTEGEYVFEAVLTDSKGAVTTIEKIITVTKNVVTSSNDKLDVNNLTAFPNPSGTGIFTLSYSTDFEVHSINGGQLLTGNGDKIDLSSYPKGVYFLKVNQKVIQLVR